MLTLSARWFLFCAKIMPGDGRSVSWVASAEDLCLMCSSAFADILQRFHHTYIYLTKPKCNISNVPLDAVYLRHRHSCRRERVGSPVKVVRIFLNLFMF